MSLDPGTVARIANLARIEVPEDDQQKLATELSNILDWIEQLNEVDTAGVEPMRSVMPITNEWRTDEITDSGRTDQIMQNAPKSHDQYFVVPRVVE
ncbi:MAG: Asp-tRNA(Asn)/Glu-tRNA(Gln) amidotransferase subunit GatC [Pseudomonadota bacterium]